MSKLRDQLTINDRLREYIERMLTVIIETSPQLLEVTTSSGVSIGSMGMSSMTSTNHQRQQPLAINNKSILPQIESVKIDSSSTIVKNPSADKYCRL
jgi:hypothetical protein